MGDLYTDGGCIKSNPSWVGGTWAWVEVEAGRLVRSASGVITPAEVGAEFVTNNVSELWAALAALEAMPAGWSGALWTDSAATLCRLANLNPSMKGVPKFMVEWWKRIRSRHGRIRAHLLEGHPTKAELKAGFGRGGGRVSEWNKYVDDLCRKAAFHFAGGANGQGASGPGGGRNRSPRRAGPEDTGGGQTHAPAGTTEHYQENQGTGERHS